MVFMTHQSAPKPGDRVRVVRDPAWNGPWPAEATGIVEPILGKPFRVINTTDASFNVADDERGEVREFMVRFDEPQLDVEGDGPYRAATVWEKYLVVLDDRPVKETRSDRRARRVRDRALKEVIQHPERGEAIGQPSDDPRFSSENDSGLS
jgi:hypothetical protein